MSEGAYISIEEARAFVDPTSDREWSQLSKEHQDERLLRAAFAVDQASFWIGTLPRGIEKLSGLFCGCVTVENTWDVILAELERLERKDFKAEDDLAASIVDHFGLSEHGTSIRGGWLTDDGVEALAFLRKWSTDWRSKGQFIDRDGITHGYAPE